MSKRSREKDTVSVTDMDKSQKKEKKEKKEKKQKKEDTRERMEEGMSSTSTQTDNTSTTTPTQTQTTTESITTNTTTTTATTAAAPTAAPSSGFSFNFNLSSTSSNTNTNTNTTNANTTNTITNTSTNTITNTTNSNPSKPVAIINTSLKSLFHVYTDSDIAAFTLNQGQTAQNAAGVVRAIADNAVQVLDKRKIKGTDLLVREEDALQQAKVSANKAGVFQFGFDLGPSTEEEQKKEEDKEAELLAQQQLKEINELHKKYTMQITQCYQQQMRASSNTTTNDYDNEYDNEYNDNDYDAQYYKKDKRNSNTTASSTKYSKFYLNSIEEEDQNELEKKHTKGIKNIFVMHQRASLMSKFDATSSSGGKTKRKK